MNDQSPVPEPDDPRWIEEILARARARAEEQFRPAAASPATAPAAPTVASPPPTIAQPPADWALAPPPASLADQALGRSSAPLGAGGATPVASTTPGPFVQGPSGSVLPPEQPASEPTQRAQPAPAPPADGDRVAPETPARRRSSSTRTAVEWILVALGALLVAFVIRATLIQAFYIPSESMEPTLNIGDRLLVNKLSYKLHDVHRGDIVVFERPPALDIPEKDLIKRVIALGGETIELRDGSIYIDDRQLTEPYVPKDATTTGLGWVKGCTNPSTEVTRCTVPAGHVFVMGDNRNHSRDSRSFGPISEDLIVGRAFVRVWPLGHLGLL